MRYYKVLTDGSSSRHFLQPGEIVLFTGFEWRENGVLFLEVVDPKGLKQLIPQIELSPLLSPQEENNLLTKNYYHASY